MAPSFNYSSSLILVWIPPYLCPNHPGGHRGMALIVAVRWGFMTLTPREDHPLGAGPGNLDETPFLRHNRRSSNPEPFDMLSREAPR